MSDEIAVILDCYTVEPSGLGVPPYLSTYVRTAYAAVTSSRPLAQIRYLTIDDVRWCLNGGAPFVEEPLSDPLTYSTTIHRDEALRLLADAALVVVVAGDAVPSVHLHAQNGSLEEIGRALTYVRGRTVLLGPLASLVGGKSSAGARLFDVVHTHTVTAGDLLLGSDRAASYDGLRADRSSYAGLVEQLSWRPVAEIELYRGCTRRRFCSFCNEPVKASRVEFRAVEDVVEEVRQLAAAGVRHFRLGQQTCFFSYAGRNPAVIEQLLRGVREACPDLEVLHIDNADPLAVASPAGARIAKLVAAYCSEGNCAPMGIESFDPVVVERNALTCTPEILTRAVGHVNEAGASRGPGGLPLLLPGLNLIYGLPGETDRTHAANLVGLARIFEAGFLCHRTNVRAARAYPGTPLAAMNDGTSSSSSTRFAAWKSDIDQLWDLPMKARVYPTGLRVSGLHAFFVSTAGTWHRRLGSYAIQILEPDTARVRYDTGAVTVTGHAPRHLYGQRHVAA